MQEGKNGFLYWFKAISFFLGKSLLLLLGLAAFCIYFINFFESKYNFDELSIAEILYIAFFLSLIFMKIIESRKLKPKWYLVFYKLFKNIGIVVFSFLVIVFLVSATDISPTNTFSLIYKNSNLIQLFIMSIILICSSWPHPNQEENKGDQL